MPMTLEQLARHLGEVAHVILPAILSRVANEIGEDAVKTAQGKLGTEQGSFGPFDAWSPLAESTLLEKERMGWPYPSPLYRHGNLRDSIGFEVDAKTTGFTLSLYSTSEYGPAQELGYYNHPPARPFLAPVFYEKQSQYNQMIGNALELAIVPMGESFANLGGTVGAMMGTEATGKTLTSSSGVWRAARSAGQRMGMWTSVKGQR